MARLDVVHGRQAAAPQAMSLERCRAVNLKNQEKFLDFTFYLCPNPRSVSAAGVPGHRIRDGISTVWHQDTFPVDFP